jgi:uncharacterized phage protein gp47/JayE
MIYRCCQQNRRNAVAEHPTLNGIDYLEVLDRDAPPGSPRQRTLMLHLLKSVPGGWTRDNVSIRGGERIRDPRIDWLAPADDLPVGELNPDEFTLLSSLPDAANVLVIRTETDGDYSDYTLSLQDGPASPPVPPTGFDPQLVEIVFSFKVECPSDFDCLPANSCEEPVFTEPDINYLAKDYASFRQLILDRMSYLLPDWRSRSAADLGVTLAELAAYVGDELSYWQDAVATEAYLHTARKRVSLRRHALMVDYRIGEGRNARAWLHIAVTGGPFELTATDIQFLTRVEGLQAPDDNRIEPDSKQHALARQQEALVFELLLGAPLTEDHNELSFYSWGDENCCLPAGATRATLLDHYPELVLADGEPGQYLLFEEVMGPMTGAPEDANPDNRQVIRLVGANLTTDPLYGTDITEIYWAEEDALKFPLCISSETMPDVDEPEQLTDVSVARGNIVLVDHGETVNEELGEVPEPWLYYPADRDSDHCSREAQRPIPPRFRPQLAESPLSHGAAGPEVEEPAAGALTPDPNLVTPRIVELLGDSGLGPLPWVAMPDLLNSDAESPHFVVELDNSGVAALRFGDDRHGARPDSGTHFSVRYRVGNGPVGNVGADSILHVVSTDGRIVAARNPLPAQGGLAPETPAQIRRRAPQAFRTQLRAVTPEDYAEFTTAQPGVQQAAANLRWTGSWHTQTITVDRDGGEELDPQFESGLTTGLERYRMAGHDLNFKNPVFVSLEIEMEVCVSRDYFRSDVQQALLDVFTSGRRSDGIPGLFHPDKFSFGQTVYLSPIYAEARQVPGVSSVHITHFSRQGEDDLKTLSDGFMSMGEFEIARLDNDPNFPEHGVLRLIMLGGK